jgi:hypothetical protein
MTNKSKAEALATVIVLINEQVENLKRPSFLIPENKFEQEDNTEKIKALQYYSKRFQKRLEKLL